MPGNLKTAPQISIPGVVFCLQSTNATLRASSAEALGKFGSQALSAVPASTNALADVDNNVQACAAEALHNIAPEALTNANDSSIAH